MAGRGMPPVGRGRTGDLKVVVNVVIPRRLSRKQKELLEQFSETLTRGQPARERGHDREAQTGAGRVIRLGIRVRAVDAEVAYARLEPILAAGFEEVAHGDDVEFAIYGDDVSNERLRALARRSLGIVAHAGRAGLGDGLARPPGAGDGRRAHDPPAVAAGRGTRRGPGGHVRAGVHPTTRLCLELLQELPPTALADWGCGCGVLSVAAAHLGFDPVIAIELDPGAVATARRTA